MGPRRGVACLTVGSWLADRAVQGLAIVSVLVGVAVLSADLLGDSEGGQIAAVVLGIALLAGAVVAMRLGAGTPSEPAPPAPASIFPAPPTHRHLLSEYLHQARS